MENDERLGLDKSDEDVLNTIKECWVLLFRLRNLLYTDVHQPETQMRFESSTHDSVRLHQIDMCETHSERTARGVHSISSHKSKRACGLSLHIPKEFACEGLRGLVGDPKRHTCPACPRLAQNISPMNSGVKFMNNDNMHKYMNIPLPRDKENYSTKLNQIWLCSV